MCMYDASFLHKVEFQVNDSGEANTAGVKLYLFFLLNSIFMWLCLKKKVQVAKFCSHTDGFALYKFTDVTMLEHLENKKICVMIVMVLQEQLIARYAVLLYYVPCSCLIAYASLK